METTLSSGHCFNITLVKQSIASIKSLQQVPIVFYSIINKIFGLGAVHSKMLLESIRYFYKLTFKAASSQTAERTCNSYASLPANNMEGIEKNTIIE